MSWITPILNFLADLALKLAGPVLAYFTGKEVEKRKEVERENAAQKERADKLADAHRLADRVDRLSDDDLDRLRDDLNARP